MPIATIQDQVMILIPLKPELVWVKGGSFLMGSETSETDQRPVFMRQVEDFFIGKYPVTVGQYRYFCEETFRDMPNAPRWGWVEDHPMVNVTFDDANAYCDWLNALHGGGCRLPTEEEWEYVAKGGVNQDNFIYSGSDDVDEIGYFYEDEDFGSTQPVGTKAPNSAGVYDLSGQVWEWCNDWYKPYSNKEEPINLNHYNFKVLRGGSWADAECYWEVTWRDFNPATAKLHNCGFRIVLT